MVGRESMSRIQERGASREKGAIMGAVEGCGEW